MTTDAKAKQSIKVNSVNDMARLVDYSLMDTLQCDPQASADGEEHNPRQVYSGHYVPVKPTPIGAAKYVAHSATLFDELGFAQSLATTPEFAQLFTGDLSDVPAPIRPMGWATGYALSIYGTEYNQQCPFRTGNGYGDGRAISVLELVANGKRWEMQLKGGGRTPYCRGADGRAVLRSSVREFLAQEYMHALGIPTSRSLCLFASTSEFVERPWYSENAYSEDPDTFVSNPVAITTRVAPSFLRVGQLELFSRRVRNNAHESARHELEAIVAHLIEREYADVIDATLDFTQQLIALAREYRSRLTKLMANWIRVGYCQGNFNSDNCAGGGFTLDYGPFGFCEQFDPFFQPWTGGGDHFSFLNQPFAAELNFATFCSTLEPLLSPDGKAELEDIRGAFSAEMEYELNTMWAAKLGLIEVESEFVLQLLKIMAKSSVDYTMFFRELSFVPNAFDTLLKCFYHRPNGERLAQWQAWFKTWRVRIEHQGDVAGIAARMKEVNPKYTWREWLVVPAYQQAASGDYSLIAELQQVFSDPYGEQTAEIEAKYYQLKPAEFFNAGGVSHYSCSS
ncbi:protein adenylyltransferase SelO family protein [Alteromonas sp. ASW11-36]|uniref:Protein nucleotidyltransferase YdiU n=1 Tax=Alteromonas arenosi TaxID=3055817 RepID=A0ABT7SZH3_9ALTE|nr:protein adenylyltransferase SelO family protein [Alteromonas sp. ASW11-36]MDM7861591.1 protein adenylyltransferase SelO family protein [Alteromonas sp. ASW11-36]